MELVLEIGPADGDLGYALELCAAAKESGADAVKGQLYTRDLLVAPSAPTYAHGLDVPETQYEDFARQLTWAEWAEVVSYGQSIGLEVFFSVFDLESLFFADELGCRRVKIASGDITFRQLIEATRQTRMEVILSTGASTGDEIQRAVSWLHYPFTLLACTLSYPCPPEDANLRRMESLRLYTSRVGYSDHTRGIGAIVRARELGAVMVEKHFTLRPGTGGDHDFAVTPDDLADLTLAVSNGERIYDGVPALEPTDSERKARIGARRSLHAAKDLVQGTLLDYSYVRFLRPGGGLEPWQLSDYAGRPLRVDVPAGTMLTEEMF